MVYLCFNLENCFVCLCYKMKLIMSLFIFEIIEYFCYFVNRYICVIILIYDD